MHTLPFAKRVKMLRPIQNLESAPSLFIMCILVLYPLLTLLLQIVFPKLFSSHSSWHFTMSEFARVLKDPFNLEAIGNSFWIGCIAAVISVVIGTITAFGSLMVEGRLKTFINTCVWIIFFAPSFVIASGWVILLQGGGVLQQLLGVSPDCFNWFFSPAGLLLVMGLRYFPFCHFAMTQAIQNVGPEYIRAARMLGAKSLTIFIRIWLRLLMPALFAGATIAFAEGFGDFGLASVITPQLQLPLVSYQIYSALYELPVDFSSAAVLSLLVIVITSAALLFQFWWLQRKSYRTLSGTAWTQPPARGWTRFAVVTLTVVIVSLGLLLPFGATLIQSFWKNSYLGFHAQNWTLQNYKDALASGSAGVQALIRTAEYALLTAGVVTILGLFIGQQLTFNKSLVSRVLNTITMATIAIPGVVLGVGYVFAWNANWLVPLHLAMYGTPVCLALAYVAVHLPYAVRLQLAAMAQISPNLLTAAQILGAKKRLVVRKIVVPLVVETVISTALIAFTGVMFELPAASLLYPSGEPPYSVLVDHLFADFQWAAGSCLTIVGMLVVFGSYVLGNLLLRKGIRVRGQNSAFSHENSSKSDYHSEPATSVSVAP